MTLAALAKPSRISPTGRCSLALASAFLWLVAPLAAQEIEPLTDKTLTLEERSQLRCPSADSGGPFAEPVEIGPALEVVVSATFSDGDDLVRIAGEEAATLSDLGPGDNTVLIFDTGTGLSVTGGSGADTFLLCSMKDLSVTLVLGSFTGRDAVGDVVLVDTPVFSEVPPGMFRRLTIFEFDRETDRIVIRAPRELIDTRQASLELQGIRLGDVLVKIYDAVGSGRRSNVDVEKGVVFIPSDEKASDR